jgi:phage gp46-like protein
LSNPREGDLKLYQTADGAEITCTFGEPEMEAGLFTSVFISLFESDNTDNWLNEYLQEDEKIEGQFYSFIKGAPKTISNINKAIEYVKQDLDWMIRNKSADEINVDITSTDVKSILLEIEIVKDGSVILDSNFNINWMYQVGVL